MMMSVRLNAQTSFIKYFGGTGNDYPAVNIVEFNNRYYFSGYYPRVLNVYSLDGIEINSNLNIPFPEYRYDNILLLNKDTLLSFGAGGDIAARPTFCRFTKDGNTIDLKSINLLPNEASIFFGVHDKNNSILNTVGAGGRGNTNLITFQKIDFQGNLLRFRLIDGTEGYDRILGMFAKRGSSDFLVFTQTELFTLDSMGFLKDRRLHRPLRNGTTKVVIEDVLQETDGTFTAFSRNDGTFSGNLSCFRHDTSGLITRIDSIPSVLEGSEIPVKFCKTSDGGYVFACDYLFKVDSLLKLKWVQHLDDDINLVKIAQAADGGFYGCGEKYFEATKLDYMIFKTLSDGRILTGNNEVHKNVTSAIQVYPNPTTNHVLLKSSLPVIRWRIFDLSGKLRDTGNHTSIDLSEWEKSVYVIEVQTTKSTTYHKMVKQ
jgi:hypothetical protein